MAVPYFDLARAKQRVAQEVTARWQEVLDSGAFVLGPEVRSFEEAFTQWLGAAGCVGVANGTDALVVALRALGVKPGDEVIVPAFTFFATAEAVSLVGATPVFADVDPRTYNLDPASAGQAVTARTVGIVGVHLYGRPCDITALGELCERHDLWLLEDAAQAQGARWRDRAVGTLGTLAAWSFYPSKNLGCFGDGGAVTGPDGALLERVRRIANHGQEGRYHHLEIGTNSRLDSLQAAVLNCRLPLLDADNEARRLAARSYRENLAGVGDLSFPEDPPDALCVYHQMAVGSGRRSDLIQFLTGRKIGTSIHYPSPLHHQPAFTGTASASASLPVAERAAEELVCLPMFPEITADEVDEVCEAIAAFFSS
ncbi:MAG: DegT/DnrJ/EryC1/StrS family aminotransferase [Acidobacteriota bacterium]